MGWLAYCLIGLAMASCVALWPGQGRAAVRFDCHDFAMVAGSAADFRDAGADLEKTLMVVRERSKDRTQAELSLIEREVRLVFREKKKRSRVIAELYRRCRASRGSMD